MESNSLNNFERRPPKDHFCQVWLESIQWFRRRCNLKLWTDGRRRRRRRTVTHHNSSPRAFGSGELKNNQFKVFVLSGDILPHQAKHTYEVSWKDSKSVWNYNSDTKFHKGHIIQKVRHLEWFFFVATHPLIKLSIFKSFYGNISNH